MLIIKATRCWQMSREQLSPHVRESGVQNHLVLFLLLQLLLLLVVLVIRREGSL